jgi:hypothetical protein
VVRVRPEVLVEGGDDFTPALDAAGDVVAHVEDSAGTRGRRQQRVKRRDAPHLGGRSVQPDRDVVERAFAEPAHPRLRRVQCGEEQVAVAPGFVTAKPHVPVARRAHTTVPP